MKFTALVMPSLQVGLPSLAGVMHLSGRDKKQRLRNKMLADHSGLNIEWKLGHKLSRLVRGCPTRVTPLNFSSFTVDGFTEHDAQFEQITTVKGLRITMFLPFKGKLNSSGFGTLVRFWSEEGPLL